MGERTPLYDLHLALGAKMIDFSGWEMPLHYGSQVEEHHQVRRECGVFDVSHLCVVDVTGAQAQAFLRRCWPTMWHVSMRRAVHCTAWC